MLALSRPRHSASPARHAFPTFFLLFPFLFFETGSALPPILLAEVSFFYGATVGRLDVLLAPFFSLPALSCRFVAVAAYLMTPGILFNRYTATIGCFKCTSHFLRSQSASIASFFVRRANERASKTINRIMHEIEVLHDARMSTNNDIKMRRDVRVLSPSPLKPCSFAYVCTSTRRGFPVVVRAPFGRSRAIGYRILANTDDLEEAKY